MPADANLLAREKSPYLLQHAHNPVHWHPWGHAALQAAQAEQKPILLSVGYAACHWCHVMAHESFEDPETAALMNRLFVSIKVDREERPDIDHIYMSALHALGEQGGWPLTMFLTPDGTPFWGGTYFPPEPRWGRPSFRQILQAVADAYRAGDKSVATNGATLKRALAAASRHHARRRTRPRTPRQRRPRLSARHGPGPWRPARRPEIPQRPDLPLPLAARPAHRRAGNRRRRAPHAAPDVARRHLRSSRRRLRPLQHGCAMARPRILRKCFTTTPNFSNFWPSPRPPRRIRSMPPAPLKRSPGLPAT
ncbi:MAG: thioredoxin domain-containing protein [Rhodospirillales bacterium]